MKTKMVQQIRILLTGLTMGAAEVVPGVSGGTIAFVTGIYERLIFAFHNLNPTLISTLRKEGFRATWEAADMTFLAVLFGGMGAGILLFAQGVSHVLANYPVLLWAFFFGLVVASIVVVGRQVDEITGRILSSGAAGLLFGVVVTQLIPLELEPSPASLFVGGAIAVCAWILPGLSGSFILLILGLYAFVIESVRTFDLYHLSFLGAGCVVGLMAFSQVLARMFRFYKNETLALLTGFMMGSLMKLWPWKHTLSYQIKVDGSQIPIVQKSVSPGEYELLTGLDPQILLVCGLAVFGCLLVFALDILLLKSKIGQAAIED